MRSGERSDASIAVLATRIAIPPYRHMMMMTTTMLLLLMMMMMMIIMMMMMMMMMMMVNWHGGGGGGFEIRRLHIPYLGTERSVKGSTKYFK